MAVINCNHSNSDAVKKLCCRIDITWPERAVVLVPLNISYVVLTFRMCLCHQLTVQQQLILESLSCVSEIVTWCSNTLGCYWVPTISVFCKCMSIKCWESIDGCWLTAMLRETDMLLCPSIFYFASHLGWLNAFFSFYFLHSWQNTHTHPSNSKSSLPHEYHVAQSTIWRGSFRNWCSLKCWVQLVFR